MTETASNNIPTSSVTGGETVTRPGTVANLVNRLSKELTNPRPPGGGSDSTTANVNLRKGAADIKSRRARAAFSYDPENEDELRLEVDDLIEVIGEEEEGWWRGKLHGKVGVFPSNFVKLIEEDNKKPSSEPSPPKSSEIVNSSVRKNVGDEADRNKHTVANGSLNGDAGDAKESPASLPGIGGEIAPKKLPGGRMGFGNIFEKGGISLRNAEGSKTTVDPVASVRGSTNGNRNDFASQKSSKSSTTVGDHKERCKVLFSYTAENEDELSLEVGDIVIIVSKDCEDPGWWYGEVNGKKGVFPDNFVESMPPVASNEDSKQAPPLPVSNPPPAVPAKPKANRTSPTSAEAPKKPNFAKTDSEKSATNSSSESLKDREKDKDQTVKPSSIAAKKPHGFALPGLTKRSEVKKEEPPAKSTEESASKPLQHPTVSRPKNPNRRPPSQVFLANLGKDTSPISEDLTAATSPVLPQPPQHSTKQPPLLPPGKTSTGSLSNDSTDAKSDMVSREEFEKLRREFEDYKQEATQRIRDLERMVRNLKST